jgi:hypothetical protein
VNATTGAGPPTEVLRQRDFSGRQPTKFPPIGTILVRRTQRCAVALLLLNH